MKKRELWQCAAPSRRGSAAVAAGGAAALVGGTTGAAAAEAAVRGGLGHVFAAVVGPEQKMTPLRSGHIHVGALEGGLAIHHARRQSKAGECEGHSDDKRAQFKHFLRMHGAVHKCQ